MALQKKIHDFHRQKHQLFEVQCEDIWKVINGQLVVNWWELGPGTLDSGASPDEREGLGFDFRYFRGTPYHRIPNHMGTKPSIYH